MNKIRSICIAAVLAAVAVPVMAQQATAPDGAALWRENCRSCHGPQGVPTSTAKDQYPTIPTFDSTFISSRSNDSLMAVLRLGAGRGRARGRDMKSFSDKMNAAEMRAVIDYLRTLANRRHAAH